VRPISPSTRWLAVAVATAAAIAVLARKASRSPRPILVEDRAELMSAAQRRRLAEYHSYLVTDHDIDYRIVTVSGVEDVNSFAVEQFERLAATTRSRSGRGLLLVIDSAHDLVRLEVGYGLEGTYPDAFVAYLEHRQMVPFFARHRVADGILAATELIVTRAQRSAANAGFEGEVWSSGSGGAGATAPAHLKTAPEPPPPARRKVDRTTGRTPARTLEKYFAVMRERDGDPELEIYTPETRRLLRTWVMTPAQMDNVTRTYRSCHAEPARFAADGELAVIRYPVRERECAPWFFRRTEGGWALDLTMMQRAIRFGRTNAWHFAPEIEHPYRFAFSDWRFDPRGFPLE
jgi:uncharacterized protein